METPTVTIIAKKNSLSVLLWGVCFLALFCILGIALARQRGPALVQPRSFESHLCKLNERITRYESSTQSPKVAITGSSYVSMLGDESRIFNLGLHSARPSEYSPLADLCGNRDTVLCAVTIRDIAVLQGRAIAKDECRLPVRYSWARDLWICRNIVRSRSHFFMPQGIPTEISNRDINTAKQYLNGVPDSAARQVVQQCLWFPMEADHVSLDLFQEMHEHHPNVVFVLFPIAPFTRPSAPQSLVEERLQAFLDTDAALKGAFANSDLPYVSVHVQPSGFKDTWHYNDAGAASIWRQLESIYCPT